MVAQIRHAMVNCARHGGSEAANPELQWFTGFSGLADILPREMGDCAGQWRVATLAPEIVERAVIRRAGWVIPGADHGAEGAVTETVVAGMVLAQIEEAVPGPVPAPLRQQHRFGAVKHVVEIEPASRKGLREIIGVIGKRRARRCADEGIAVEGA